MEDHPNAGQIGILCDRAAVNKKNLVNLIPTRELMQKHYPKKQLYIIGLAGGDGAVTHFEAMIVCEQEVLCGGLSEKTRPKKKEETQCTSSFNLKRSSGSYFLILLRTFVSFLFWRFAFFRYRAGKDAS